MKKIFSLFAAILFAGSMMAVDITFGWSQWDGVTGNFSGNTKDEVTQTVDGVVVTYTRNGASLYANSSAIRFYVNNTIKFEAPSGYTITNISFTGSAFKAGVTTDVKTCTSSTSALSWKGDASSVTFTRSSGSSYITLTGAEVTLKAASTDPSVAVDPKALDFGLVEKDAVIEAKTFTLTGSNLTDANKVTVTAPAGYKVSIGDADPATSLELTPSSKSIASTTIKVTPVTSEAGTFNSNITISSDDLDADSTVALTMTVVAPVAVESVSLDKETLSLTDGDTYTLTATIAPDEATNKNVTWESSDEDIATVDENGLVTAKETGKATITCKSVADNTKTATCVVTVSGADVVLDFTSNDGWNFPTDSKETTEDTFTKGDYSVTLGGGYQYYEGEILVGKTNAYMKLPVFANNAIAKIVTVGTETGSASVTFNVFDGTTAVSTEVTSCKVDQTFIISPKKKNVEYTIKITNNNNARFPKIKIYFGEPDPATAIDNTEATVKAVKFVENGQLFIEKNGHVYNVQGQIVK